MAAILWASGDQLGVETTGPWVERILLALFGPMTKGKLYLIHAGLRKSGHVVAYALLSWLALRATRATAREYRGRPARWSWRWALVALAFVLLTSASDEFLQSRTQKREGTYRDVLLDLSGALLAQTVLMVAAKRKP